MTSRKQLMLEIASLEKELLIQKIHNYKHKHYLSNFVNEHKFVILAMLIPAVVLGWKAGRTKSVGKISKQIGRLAFLASMANMRKRLWRSFSQTLSI